MRVPEKTLLQPFKFPFSLKKVKDLAHFWVLHPLWPIVLEDILR